MLTPLKRIIERVEDYRQESDLSYFSSLMYLGEMVTKIVVAGMVAAIKDDKDRLRYSQLHALVRANGIGEWAQQLDQILIGPASQILVDAARIEQRQLTQKFRSGDWQYDAVECIHRCCTIIQPNHNHLSSKLSLSRAFHLFSQLRNKSPRGHGATPHKDLTEICPPLAEGLNLIIENFSIFSRQWAILHRNLSGKYHVTNLSESDSNFYYLKKSKSENFENGIYIFFETPCLIELMHHDANDFFLANGSYTEKQHEFISYITGGTIHRDSTPYHSSTTTLPQSETEGIHNLDVIGNCFTNIPQLSGDIVSRSTLEEELTKFLDEKRHEIVTLIGRGGIGKTTLSLQVIHRLALSNRFSMIIWFSSRDIELTSEGPKQVRPFVLNIRDISNEYVRLTQPKEAELSEFDSVKFFSDILTQNNIGSTLFVFDNFETVSNPLELYKWLDTYIRPPNKILITTRFRDFKGDYPIEVHGMNDSECQELINVIGCKLNIEKLITKNYTHKLIEESDGHPYVIKILLGEIAKENKLIKVQRIMAGKEEILTALFERTYNHLPPASQRIFLTLANWNSAVPLVAIQAVLLRIEHERIDVIDAIETLSKSSFIILFNSEQDGQDFIHVPLTAATFGKAKLQASPYRAAVDADTKLLHQFGAATLKSVTRGVESHVKRFITFVASKAEKNASSLNEYSQILEVIAHSYPPAWLHIAVLYAEMEKKPMLDAAKAAIRKYLEHSDSTEDARPWKLLADYCRKSNDLMGEAHALVELTHLENVELNEISTSANRLNSLLSSSDSPMNIERDEKIILVERMADALEARIDEGNATDRSRLAWLCLHLHDTARAQQHVNEGLALEPDNNHCLNLNARLQKQHSF